VFSQSGVSVPLGEVLVAPRPKTSVAQPTVVVAQPDGELSVAVQSAQAASSEACQSAQAAASEPTLSSEAAAASEAPESGLATAEEQPAAGGSQQHAAVTVRPEFAPGGS